MAKMTGAQAVVRCLEHEGVEYVFGMSGHGNLPLLDALCDSTIKFIEVPHEQIAVHMADCYFRMTHRPGIVLTTLGPGFTNTVTGMADAMQDCSAVVMLSGNAPVSHSGVEAYQEVSFHHDGSQEEVLRPIVKRTWRVSHHRRLPYILGRALNFALSGCPGPVLVDVPMDVFSMTADFPSPDSRARRVARQRSAASDEDIASANVDAHLCGIGRKVIPVARSGPDAIGEECPAVPAIKAKDAVRPSWRRLYFARGCFAKN